MSISLRRAFRDIRATSQILASAKAILDVNFSFSLPVPPKIRSFLSSNFKKGITKAFTSGLKQAALAGATGGASVALTYAMNGASILRAARSAKQVFGALAGKKNAAVSSLKKATTLAGLGASIKNQMDPEKLRRPFFGPKYLKEGFSIDPAQAGKSLAQTWAFTSMKSLTRVQIAAGVAGKLKVFKDLDSLKKSPRYFDFSKASQPNPPEIVLGSNLIEPVVTANSVLYSQSGLTADEIMYRLTLLAENVYYPVNEYAIARGYGSLEILEAFRSENSGSSQHERGEAFDFTLSSGINLYNLARWMRDNILYDQLILCFSRTGGPHWWIHVSFAPDTRRRLVLTKTANDDFIPGLHYYTDYTSANQKNKDIQEATENAALASSLVQQLIANDSKLNPIGTNTTELTDGIVGGEEERCLVDSLGIKYVPDNSARGDTISIVNSMLRDPRWLEVISRENRRESVSFLQEVVSRLHAAGHTNIGVHAVRGVSSDPSCDVISIKNPTGSKNFGSWRTRVQQVDVVTNANSPEASAGWGDSTSLCETATGGFLNHITLQPEDGAPSAPPPPPPPPPPGPTPGAPPPERPRPENPDRP